MRPEGQVRRAREVKRNPTHQLDLVTEQVWEASEESRRTSGSLGWVTGQRGTLIEAADADEWVGLRKKNRGRFACAPCEVSTGGSYRHPFPRQDLSRGGGCGRGSE